MESRAKHYEYMENLMEAEAFQNREIGLFQRINHRTDGIHNAACQKHPQSAPADGSFQRNKRRNRKPAHADINQRREPTRCIHPEDFHKNAENCNPPYCRKQSLSPYTGEDYHADRCIGSCD